MYNFFVFILSYLITGINPSIIISNKVLKKDIRNLGSGNAGTTNSIRTMGKKWGTIVFCLDLLKVTTSYIVILLIAKLFSYEVSNITKTIYMLASVLGHSYPIYYSFKGGKGVAVFLMSAFLIDFKLAIISTAIGVLVILISRYVSLGSMVGAIMLVLTNIFMKGNYNIFILILTVIVIVYNHRENIIRLLNNKENKLF